MIIGEYPVGNPPGIGNSYIDQSISYYIDEITTFTGVEPIEGGFRYSLNRLSGIYLLKHLEATHESIVAIGKNAILNTYKMSIGLLNPIIYYSFDLEIRPSYDSTVPSTSVIDALVWSYADMFDAIWRQMETMSNALKLEYALGTDLDDAWGQIFDLPRIYNEDDTSYRDRLKTRTIILNSSGTKTNCETIIDSIIGSSATTITTRYPASVDITFSSETAMRIAKDKATTLSILIPQMLAHGITYNMFLPISDYDISILMKGSDFCNYNLAFATGYFNVDNSYTMLNTIYYQYEFLYDMKILSKKPRYKYFHSDIVTIKTDNNINYNIKSYIRNNNTIQLEQHNYIKKYNVIHPFIVDQYLLKYNIEKSYSAKGIVLNNVPRRCEFDLILV